MSSFKQALKTHPQNNMEMTKPRVKTIGNSMLKHVSLIVFTPMHPNASAKDG